MPLDAGKTNQDYFKNLAAKRISKIIKQTEQEYDPKLDWQGEKQKQRLNVVNKSLASLQNLNTKDQEHKATVDGKRRPDVNIKVQGLGKASEPGPTSEREGEGEQASASAGLSKKSQ